MKIPLCDRSANVNLAANGVLQKFDGFEAKNF